MRHLVVLSSLLLVMPAQAHFDLDVPARRYNENENKGKPCGRSGDNTRATDPAKITTYVAGSTVLVQWRETINHTGRWHISFDDAGSDEADFDAHVLVDIADDTNGNVSAGRWQAQLTLPSTPCTTCTLRVQQIMTSSANPLPSSIYTECADLVLTASPGGEGEGEGSVVVAEGEGEGSVVVSEGEGEGSVVVAEGEGEGSAVGGEGEGEGAIVVAEGEGEGSSSTPGVGGGSNAAGGGDDAAANGCSSVPASSGVAAGALLTALVRRRRRCA